MKALLITSFLLFTCGHYVVGEHTDLCRLFKDGTQFRRPDTCNEFIVCQNATGEIYSCTSPSMYDRNKATCVETLSDCDANPCAGVNGKWVADPNNCHMYFYCSSSVAYPGSCDFEHHFDEKKQACVFGSTSDCFEVSDICSFLPDKTTFRDDNDCTVYYECSNGKKSKKTCSKTYFDVQKGACVDKALVQCTSHPLPSNVCGTDKKPAPGFKADGATCRGYFYCENLGIVRDLNPTWGQCPEGLFLNTTTQLCVQPIQAYCTFNRCEGRGTRMVSASSNDCHNYIICENGIPVEERTCSGDKFFDEEIQACVNRIISYPNCDGRK